MNQLQYEANSVMERTSSTKYPKRTKQIPLWLLVTGVGIIWLLVALGWFLLSRYYVGNIQGQLDQIKQSNAVEIKQLNEKLTSLQAALEAHRLSAETLQAQFTAVESELTAVKEEMSLAGSSLSTTAETKQALNDRITDLSNELDGLRKLIKKLEEAARVY